MYLSTDLRPVYQGKMAEGTLPLQSFCSRHEVEGIEQSQWKFQKQWTLGYMRQEGSPRKKQNSKILQLILPIFLSSCGILHHHTPYRSHQIKSYFLKSLRPISVTLSPIPLMLNNSLNMTTYIHLFFSTPSPLLPFSLSFHFFFLIQLLFWSFFKENNSMESNSLYILILFSEYSFCFTDVIGTSCPSVLC